MNQALYAHMNNKRKKNLCDPMKNASNKHLRKKSGAGVGLKW
jgi:hypothetical protein